MTKYFNNISAAKNYAAQLKLDEPDYADNVQIFETNEESFGIYAETKKGQFGVTNETE